MSTSPALGTFVWHDLMTTDGEVSHQFYSQLFPEWKIKVEVAQGYTYRMVHVGDRPLCCMVPFDKSYGYPSHWVGYVAVENCDATATRMEQLGGKICCPPYDAPGVGRFALVNDPQGAIIKPFQMAKGFSEPGTPEVGRVCWNELMTTDLDKATAFYTSAFGWETHTHDFGPPMGKYVLFRSGGKDLGGSMTLPPGAEAPPHWMHYFLVEDVDVRTRKAGEVGARIYVAPRDIPGIGRFSVLADPEGATFALYKSVPGAKC